jgi:hypothetical protein
MNKQDAEDECDRLERMAVPFQLLLAPNGLWDVRVELPGGLRRTVTRSRGSRFPQRLERDFVDGGH